MRAVDCDIWRERCLLDRGGREHTGKSRFRIGHEVDGVRTSRPAQQADLPSGDRRDVHSVQLAGRQLSNSSRHFALNSDAEIVISETRGSSQSDWSTLHDQIRVDGIARPGVSTVLPSMVRQLSWRGGIDLLGNVVDPVGCQIRNSNYLGSDSATVDLVDDGAKTARSGHRRLHPRSDEKGGRRRPDVAGAALHEIMRLMEVATPDQSDGVAAQ